MSGVLMSFQKWPMVLIITCLACVACLMAAVGVWAWEYPNYGALPTAMNIPGGSVYHFKTAGYNPDGTDTSNPVITLGTAPIDVSKYPGYTDYVFKTLTTGSTIQVGDKTFTVYAALPENMTVAQGFADTASYYPDVPATPPAGTTWGLWNNMFLQYPTDVEAKANQAPYNTATNTLSLPQIYNALGLNYNDAMAQYQVIPTSLNGGNAFDLNGISATTSSATGTSVKVIPSGSSGAGYYLPYVTDSSYTGHNDLTSNVVWTTDIRMNNRTAFPNGPDYHLLPYGWALDSKNCNESLSFQNLGMEGGSASSVSTLANASDPFNFWLKLISNQAVQYKTVNGNDVYYPVGTYSDLVRSQVQALQAAGGAGYPFPDPTWLNDGAFMPIQPSPGFQSNMIRWYTAWGAWNLLNNTSGLFVQSDGDVEIPVDASGNPIPLTTQTWLNQNYTIVNATSAPIPSSTDTYPGGEIYLAGNTYFPGQAGVMNAYRQYMIFDNQNQLTPRTPDNWLGLKGDTISDVMDWADAGGTEPGGQANKLYMYDVNIDQNNQISFGFEISNSTAVAKQTAADVDGKLYDATVMIDAGDGNGYQSVMNFGFEWQARALEDVSGQPQWQKSSSTGALVPWVNFNVTHKELADLGLKAQAFKAASWDAANRGEIVFDAVDWTDATLDNSGSYYYQYQLNGTLNENAKILVMLGDGTDL